MKKYIPSAHQLLIGIFISLHSVASGQCPEVVNVSFNENCVYLTWSNAPVPAPFDLVYNNKLYSYESGDGEVNPATYRQSANDTCEFNDFGFTGVLEIDGLPCSYLGGDPDPEPLPVTLISFDGEVKHDHVLLTWKTSYELQNKEFRVERSIQDGLWTKVEVVKGQGDYDAIREYEIKDYSAREGVNLYRLVQIDLDGTEFKSDIIALEVHEDFDGMSLSPNPASESFRVNGIVDGLVTLFSLEGRVIDQFNLSQRNDNDIRGISSGVYVVRVVDESGSIYTEKLVIR